MNVNEDLAMIPYSLLCTTAMNVEVITLVILVGTGAFFFLDLLLGTLVLNVLYLGLYIFVVALLSLIRNYFMEGFCSSDFLAINYLTCVYVKIIFKNTFCLPVQHIQFFFLSFCKVENCETVNFIVDCIYDMKTRLAAASFK